MNLKYVSSKSKFVDVDAERPRLLNMETAYNILKQHGVHNPEIALATIMLAPIPEAPKEPEYRQYLRLYDVQYKKSLWYVQGVAYDLAEAADRLVQQGMNLSSALRALAFAVDLFERNR